MEHMFPSFMSIKKMMMESATVLGTKVPVRNKYIRPL